MNMMGTLICALVDPVLLLIFAPNAWVDAKTNDEQVGLASWYGGDYSLRRMANGQPYDPTRFTCASRFYPLGARLRVTRGNKQVLVDVTDRGPAWKHIRQGRIIDLSEAAFMALADRKVGLIYVAVKRVPLTKFE